MVKSCRVPVDDVEEVELVVEVLVVEVVVEVELVLEVELVEAVEGESSFLLQETIAMDTVNAATNNGRNTFFMVLS
jgi:hypothetical protein